MVKRYCDRCGSETAEPEDPDRVVFFNRERRDLCYECARALDRWMEQRDKE